MKIIKHDIDAETKQEITKEQAMQELGQMYDELMESFCVSCGITVWEVKP